MSRVLRSLATFVALLAVANAGAALAHPLGNFTINHLARVTVRGEALHVRYVLDIAEIPTFQIMHGSSGSWNRMQWASGEIGVVQSGLHLQIDGVPAVLQAQSASAALRAGAGGLPILRWVGEFSVPVARASAHHVALRDEVYADRRIGWKDVVIGSQSEPTNELRRYPSTLIGTPRRIDAATFSVLPSRAIANIHEVSDDSPGAATGSSWISAGVLSDMLSRPNQNALFVLLTIFAAFGLGALLAMEPGHGKALLAFTLVGARATSRQALTLALSLTLAHTAGVLLLGIVLFAAAGFVSESIYPWITLISGAAIAIIGARSLAAFVRSRGHTHTHSHAIPGTRPLNFRTAVVAAMSGGIAPCPAAIVVLLAALRLHHVGYGLVLIVVFSMGLASALSGLGIGVVRGTTWVSQRSSYTRIAPYGPLVTALVISTIGAWTLASGFTQNGVGAPAPLIALLALMAIGGYAIGQGAHDHAHSHPEAHTP